jgi:hypothetical protein
MFGTVGTDSVGRAARADRSVDLIKVGVEAVQGSGGVAKRFRAKRQGELQCRRTPAS